MKGSYILLIQNDRLQDIKVGKLDSIKFKPGYYVYVGSALTNLEKRVRRHQSMKKKLFWHIDYLLEKTEIVNVFQMENPMRLECSLAEKLSGQLQSFPKFGCSDCRCKSHLFFHEDKVSALWLIFFAAGPSNI